MTDTPAEREDISIWAKLRRRRVVQWGLAYAAGAWVLLQVLGFVSDSFAWPATVKQIATIILAVGLPIVVVLGWYHGERGQRRVSGPELAVLMNEVSTASRLVAATLKKWPDNDWANSGAIALAAALRDTAAMERHAIKVLARYPRDTGSLQLLRAADLRRGDPKAAQARYATAFPELFAKTVPRLSLESCSAAVDLALVLQRMGEPDRAAALLDASERFTHSIPRLGAYGYGILDVSIHALRGDNAKAFAALREAENAGWRGPLWRYFRDDPSLDSIRNEPEFKAVFADIERDMARQRARLAARPKGAPLELTDA